jgi:ribosomal protein S27AE
MVINSGRSCSACAMTDHADHAQYTPEEQQNIRAVIVAGDAPSCPRCGVVLTTRPIGGGSFGLGYARRHEWLICPQCKRSAIFDVKRGTRN